MAKGTIKKVKARWVGGYPVTIPNVPGIVDPGDVVEIPEGEAHESDNWEVVGSKKQAKDKDGGS